MKIKAGMVEFMACGFAAKAMRGEMSPNSALGAILLYSTLTVLERHGLKNIPTELMNPLYNELAERCSPMNTQENVDLFEKIIAKHLERLLEAQIYRKA